MAKKEQKFHPGQIATNLATATGLDFLFIDDNARSHSSVEVSDTLQSENILHMQLPAYSPSLNPIEHAWNALCKRIAQRTIFFSIQCKNSKPT
ncbi:hypothetical protein TNCV_461501 [Trichonephila clavipes]|nr:hypothetical protein TNCV_461501 [Trichonephila clavipes]